MIGLSPQQELILHHYRLVPGSSAYHAIVALDLRGPLDVDALRRAIDTVVHHHPALRLALCDLDSARPNQLEVAHVDINIEEADLSAVPADQQATRLTELVDDFGTRPFDLTRAPLARWCLVRLAPEHHTLVHVEDHLIHDGRSFVVLLDDLLVSYRELAAGRQPQLPPAVSYASYVARCQSSEFRAKVNSDLDWWRRQLSGAQFGNFNFRGLARRVGTRTGFGGAQLRQELCPDLRRRLEEVARQSGSTLFGLLFGLFGELMRRHDGGSEVLLGSAVADRPAAFARMVGMLVNTLPVRLPIVADTTVRQLAVGTLESLFDALDHADAPIQEIVHAVGRSSGALDNPLFRCMFSQNDAGLPDVTLADLDVAFEEGINRSTSRSCDIDVVLLPGRRALGGHDDGRALFIWDYSTEFFDANGIGLLADRWRRLLESAAAATPDTRLSELSMTGPEERSAVLDGPAPSGPGTPLLERIRRHAADPDRTALISGIRRIGYAELLDGVDQLHDGLDRLGIRRGDVVVTIGTRSPAAIELMLACLAGGFVFTPLPESWTDAAIADAVDRLGPSIAFADPGRVRALAAAGVTAAPTGGALPSVLTAALDRRRQETAAYIMHTSGSSGRPKRVAVPHRGLVNEVDGVTDFLSITGQDRVLQFAQPAFDVFFEEVLPTLAAGGCLVQPGTDLPDGADLAALIAFREITVLNLPTAYFGSVLPDLREHLSGRPHRLRTVVVGGERLPADLAADAAGLGVDVEIVNAYGVTESAITSTMARYPGSAAGYETPLGRPLAGVVVAVVAPDGTPAPIGTAGEIVIGGPGSESCYLDGDGDGDGGQAFQAGLAGRPGRWYRTGDIGMVGVDGQLSFLGRADRQVKVRGHRIEPEEIELAVRALLRDTDVAVVPRMVNGVVEGLVGYLETSDPSVAAGLSQALATVLPRYLYVERWLTLGTLPRLANGKVDLAALAGLAVPDQVDRAAEALAVPGDDLVLHTVLSGFRAVLRRDDVGPDEDFFVSGGHSLLAANLVAWLHRELGVRPRMSDVFDAPTARAVAERLRARGAGTTSTAGAVADRASQQSTYQPTRTVGYEGRGTHDAG